MEEIGNYCLSSTPYRVGESAKVEADLLAEWSPFEPAA